MNNETLTKLKILARAEMALVRINARLLTTKTIYIVLAIVLFLSAVAMLNLAAFLALSSRYGGANAALLLAVGDVAVAVVLASLGYRLKGGADEKIVREIREMAVAELSEDVDNVKRDFTRISEGVDNIRKGLGVFQGSGSSSLGLAGLGPTLGFVIDLLKRRGK